MVMLAGQGSQQRNINFDNPFSNLSQDPAIQQGLLGNWAFNFANQGDNGGRSYFENFSNFPNNPQTGSCNQCHRVYVETRRVDANLGPRHLLASPILWPTRGTASHASQNRAP